MLEGWFLVYIFNYHLVITATCCSDSSTLILSPSDWLLPQVFVFMSIFLLLPRVYTNLRMHILWESKACRGAVSHTASEIIPNVRSALPSFSIVIHSPVCLFNAQTQHINDDRPNAPPSTYLHIIKRVALSESLRSSYI